MNTPTSWSQIGFAVEITEDGSPSLRLVEGTKEDRPGESMHHSGGAASETDLIYGQPIKICFQGIGTPHFHSVGLGLGYVEMVIAREAVHSKNFAFSIESWELVPELKDALRKWLFRHSLVPEIQKVYDSVVEFVSGGDRRLMEEIQSLLRTLLENSQWTLHGALTNTEQNLRPAHGILFDAFSAKTTPALWTEEFLQGYFTKGTAADAFIATYASRTSLKRALIASGYEILIREGFKGKRNSTLAFKGRLQPIFAAAGIS